MVYWEAIEVVRYDEIFGYCYTEIVTRFRTQPIENPGWRPHYSRSLDPPEHVPR